MHGVEGHVCSKCGWSFPNPHPSAKQRRSHKKACGTIQGFKISQPPENNTHFTGSEDNPQSDNKVFGTDDSVRVCGGIGRQESKRSEDEEFKDASADFGDNGASSTTAAGDVGIAGLAEPVVKATEIDGTIVSSSSPTRNHQIQTHALEHVEDQMQADSHQDHHGSNSTMNSMMESISHNAGGTLVTEMINGNGSNTEAATNLYPENTQIIDNFVDSRQFMDKEGDGDESVSTFEASSDKTTSESPEIDAKLQRLEGCTGGEAMLVFDDSSTNVSTNAGPTEGLVDSKEENNAGGLKRSQDEIFIHTDEGHSVNEQKISLSTLQPEDIPVEELSEATIKDTKEHDLMESRLDVNPDSCEAINEVVVQVPYSEGAHSCCLSSKTGESADGSSSAVQGLKDNLEQDEMGCKDVVEGQRDTPLATDTVSEVADASGFEALADDTTSGMTLLQAEAKQIVSPYEAQELEYPQRENEILPETHLVIEAGQDTQASPTKSVNLKATDAVNAETRVENSDITLSCSGKPINESCMIATSGYPQGSNCVSEYESRIRETERGSYTVVDSSDTGINGPHLANTSEFSDEQIFQNEKIQEGSDELEFSENVDLPSSNNTEVQYESIDTNKFVAKNSREDAKSNHSSEVGTIQNSADDPPVNEVMPSAVGTGSCALSSGGAQANISKGVSEHVPDSHPQLLQNDGHNIVKQQSDASVVALDGSIDSFSQTDSVEGFWGSVSDGTNHSVKDSTNIPSALAIEAQPETVTPVLNESAKVAELKKLDDTTEAQTSDNIYEAPSIMTLVEPGRKEDEQSADSEIQTIQNSHQPNLSSSQAGWFPSVSHNVKESQGRKKNEEIIEKVTKCISVKEHTPLRNLLVEANVESKQKVRSTKSHSDKTSTLAQVIQASETAAEPQAATSHVDVDKANAEKEWNSPARLPMGREKRKVRYWTPFVCCSSIN